MVGCEMTEQELRAWSLSIIAILNDYECDRLEFLLDSKGQEFIKEIQEYIKSGKIERHPIEGLHESRKRFKGTEKQKMDIHLDGQIKF
jgi:hypothetical protein